MLCCLGEEKSGERNLHGENTQMEGLRQDCCMKIRSKRVLFSTAGASSEILNIRIEPRGTLVVIRPDHFVVYTETCEIHVHEKLPPINSPRVLLLGEEPFQPFCIFVSCVLSFIHAVHLQC